MLQSEYLGATLRYEGLRILRLPDVKPPCLTCPVFGPGNFFVPTALLDPDRIEEAHHARDRVGHFRRMADIVERVGRGFHRRLVRLRRLHLLLQGGDVAQDVAEFVFGKSGLAHFLAEARQRHGGLLAVVVFHVPGLRTQLMMRTVYTGFAGSKSRLPSPSRYMKSFSPCRLA